MTDKPAYDEPTGYQRAGWHADGEGGTTSYYRRLPTAWEIISAQLCGPAPSRSQFGYA